MVCTLDKKGQIGKMITAFPVILAILLLVSGFVIFTEFIKKNNVGFNKEAATIVDNDMLFMPIKMKYDNKVLAVRVIDLVKKQADSTPVNHDKKYNPLLFYDSLMPLVHSNKGCLVLYFVHSGAHKGYAGVKYDPKFNYQGKGVSMISGADPSYVKANKFGSFILNSLNREVTLNYYYGECIK